MKFPVRILPRAKRDFHRIFSYIEQRSPEGAAQWWEAFENGRQRVSSNPEQCGFAPENQSADYDLRQLLFKTRHGLVYRAIFTVLDDEIFILRIRGPGQPPLNLDELPLH